MNRAIFSPASRRDLREILDYIAQDSRTRARRFVDKLEQKCELLARSPHLGFECEDLLPGMRVWPVGRYLIFYRPAAAGIEIVRVVHGARDIPRLFE
jgi:toxin ParE1/3/4